MIGYWPGDKSWFLDKQNVKNSLVDSLKSGELALCLGAGVSKKLKLPLWYELVQRCCDAANLSHSSLNSKTKFDELIELMSQVQKKLKDKNRFFKEVQKSLYDGVEYSQNIIKNELLISLGALTMGSSRGSVDTIVTLNFDDVLEWYLDLHGYKIQIIQDFPMNLSNCDVRIYHPHGFLPKNTKYSFSNDAILAKDSYLDAMTHSTMPWNIILTSLFISKTFIFIGLSGNDPNLEKHCYFAMGILKDSRPLGYWFLKENKDNIDKQDSYLENGIVPVYFKSFRKYHSFLLEICQEAVL